MKKYWLFKFVSFLLLLSFIFIITCTSLNEFIYNFIKYKNDHQIEVVSSSDFNNIISFIAEESADEQTELDFDALYDSRKYLSFNFIDNIFSENISKNLIQLPYFNFLSIYTFICCYRN